MAASTSRVASLLVPWAPQVMRQPGTKPIPGAGNQSVLVLPRRLARPDRPGDADHRGDRPPGPARVAVDGAHVRGQGHGRRLRRRVLPWPGGEPGHLRVGVASAAELTPGSGFKRSLVDPTSCWR